MKKSFVCAFLAPVLAFAAAAPATPPAGPPTTPSSPQVRTNPPPGPDEGSVLVQAKVKLSGGDVAGACAVLEQGLKRIPDAASLRRELYAINKKLLLTELTSETSLWYMVKRGDNLTKIADQYAITANLLRRLNALRSDSLQIGQKLKITKGPFDVRVTKTAYTLEVMQGGATLFTYLVGLGAEASSTPTGTFAVGPKLINPTQFDAENGRVIKFGQRDHTIGTRWITFSKQFGIHGTVEPESIGKNMSQGCVRMLNEEVEELFDLLVTGKSKVAIVESLPPRTSSAPAGLPPAAGPGPGETPPRAPAGGAGTSASG